MWIKAWLLRWLTEAWYEEATTIQEKVIPLALEWKNIIWQSQTGTWKTAAFLLPLLNAIDTNLVEPQALILAPTRELVVQIYEDIYKFTKYYRVPAAMLYGWVSQVNQVTEINRKPRIIVATPWRLWDFVEQKLLDLRTVKYFVLDEVDRMLDMWFSPIIQKLRAKTSRIKQTYSFSATLNDEIINVVKTHIKWFELVKAWQEVIVDKINHSYITVSTRDKFINLVKLLWTHKKEKIVIFTNTINNSDNVYKQLVKERVKVGTINGDMSQWKRLNTMNSFINGEITILVTTDVAARWLNMEDIGLVINFDFPKESDAYIHRIWRTWRAWAYGKAITFVTWNEQSKIQWIEKQYDIIIKKSDYSPIEDVEGLYRDLGLDKSVSNSKFQENRKRTVSSKSTSSARRSWWDRVESKKSSEKSFKEIKEDYKKYWMSKSSTKSASWKKRSWKFDPVKDRMFMDDRLEKRMKDKKYFSKKNEDNRYEKVDIEKGFWKKRYWSKPTGTYSEKSTNYWGKSSWWKFGGRNSDKNFSDKKFGEKPSKSWSKPFSKDKTDRWFSKSSSSKPKSKDFSKGKRNYR